MGFNWDSQIGGVIIGAILAGVFSLIGGWTTLFIQGRRMEKQLEHDAKARESQFAHDRQQEIRGRRTDTLAELQEALEEQAEALVWLRTNYKNNKSQLRGEIEKSDRWVTLYSKQYRKKLWPCNATLTRNINKFAEEWHELQSEIVRSPQADLMSRFRATEDALSAAIGELPRLMSRINGIAIAGDKNADTNADANH